MSKKIKAQRLAMSFTNRGFAYIEFKDQYGVKCSVQDSSLATEACIWFGCDEANPQVLVPGKGWQPVELPRETVCNTRMHLTQEQVAALIPILKRFVKSGSIYSPKKKRVLEKT